MKSEHHITILFEPPFWVALFERNDNNEYSVARAVIGTSEPENAEMADFLNTIDFDRLKYTVPVTTKKQIVKKPSFKRQQKLSGKATKENSVKYVYSKAQLLLKEQLHAIKKERKSLSKAQKEEFEQHKFELKQKKKKEKHRGH